MGVSEGRAERAILLIRLLVSQQGWNEPLNQEDGSLYQVLQNLFRDSGIQRFVGVNRYQELLWFNRESFEELLRWLYLQAVLDILASEREVAGKTPPPGAQAIVSLYNSILKLLEAEAASGYQVERLLAAVKEQP